MKRPNNGIPCNYVKKNKVALHPPTMENLQDIMLSGKKSFRTGLKVYHPCVKQTLYFHVCMCVDR